MSSWSNKACMGCNGRKGPKYKDKKFCGRCVIKQRKERSRGAHARAIEKRYGITADDYNRLYQLQGGRCAICCLATGRTRRLSVDHDHRTGLVRGLLCRPCNNILGYYRDDPAAFERGAQYLRLTPWTQLAIGQTAGA